MAVLQAGELLEEGPTSQVTHALRHPYTKSLLEAAPALTKGLQASDIEG